MNFEEDIIIDDQALDVEWLRQGNLSHKYGISLSEKEKELAQAEEAFSLLEAELTDRVNQDPSLLEGGKVTVNNVQSYCIRQKCYQNAKQKIIDLKHEVRIHKIAFDQINMTRKAALENLCRLLQMSYFAGPSIPRNLHEEAQKKTNVNIANKLKRKTN